MLTNVTFRHLKSQHPELTDAANHAAEGLSKFHDGIISVDVEFMKDTKKESNKIVQLNVHIKGDVLVATAETDDFGVSLNEAKEKIERQLRKHKTKVLSSRTKNVEA